MSDAANQPTSLNRRASIRTATPAVSRPAPRPVFTLEIEVEYITSSQQPIAANRPSFRQLDIAEEDEEEEDPLDLPAGAQTPAQLQARNVQPPPIRNSTRPYPVSLPRQAPLAPMPQPAWNFPHVARSHHLDDAFASVYQPDLDSVSRGSPASSPPPAVAGTRRPGMVHSPGHAGYQVHAAIAHSDFRSSLVRHDETPALSSVGSQSDEDDDEAQSPVECLKLVEADDGVEDEKYQSSDDSHPMESYDHDAISHGPPLGTPKSAEKPELETPETLTRERTRILQRRVVSRPRQIDFKDISNVQPLKRGGYGEIHTAEWSRLRVVLKRALPEHTEGVVQFEQELEILQRVHDYDFIVPFYGVTVDPRTNVRCMVMKQCTNGNLCTFLENYHDSLTWLERYRLSIEITKGLEFLHKSGFHHRDLHSGNILLDDKRTAMICDFGLSRSSTKEQTTDIAATVGVASFLAPERFPHVRPVYTAACDIYSLGVIFWHISSGRIPFASRLREPLLLQQLMTGHREEIVPGTPTEFRDLIVKCWDKKPAKRLKIDVVIAILQTLMAKPSEPIHQISTGFIMPGDTTSAALPIPPEIDARMGSLERASNTLNKMVFDIQDPLMKDLVTYIERTRAYFRNQGLSSEPYSSINPPKTPIYLCPLVGDIAALKYYLSRGSSHNNPINESSVQTGDTALHLACLFLESPMDTIKILVELGADINLENLQGYTPVMILVSSNTQYCYEALKFFVMRGARIPAYIRNPITPLNSAQMYALNLVNESRQIHLDGQVRGAGATRNGGTGIGTAAAAAAATVALAQQERRSSKLRASLPIPNVYQERGGRKTDRIFAQGRPLIHVVAAMQEDYRILDCLCEAGLDPAMSFAGETALVAAAAHLRIKNVEWLLNHDLDISTEAGVQRAIKVVKMLHHYSLSSLSLPYATSGHGKSISSSSSNGRIAGEPGHGPRDFPDDIRDLGKFSWAGVAYGEADRMSKDMVGPVLSLLEQWTGSRRISNRKDVATKLKLMYGSSMDPRASSVSVASTNSDSSGSSQGGSAPPVSGGYGQGYRQSMGWGALVHGTRSLRKSQRHVIDQVLNGKRSR